MNLKINHIVATAAVAAAPAGLSVSRAGDRGTVAGVNPSQCRGDIGMWSMVKSAVLGAALLTGMALVAQAQSVSVSPAAGGVPAQLAPAHPFGPKPGGTKQWKHQHYVPPAGYSTDVAAHPYSDPGRIGPKPN